ncbi:MAG: type II secretion system F family protein [Candidatus Kerfeldbacteria bacterium]|nr:type II secretion system F family protein [Candidatus Kerfeldbacteria bacterium]
MPVYDYKAKDAEGLTVTGAVEAPSEAVAQDTLKERSLVVVALRERKRLTLFQSSLGFFNRVPRKDVVLFARQLAVMISATVPIVQALRILVKQTSNITFKIIVSEIADEVDGGAKLSASLARYPQAFSDFFVHMVRSGETTGKLDETLNYLADQQEKDYDLEQKIRGAMIYPSFIVGAMVIIGTLMMIFVIPKLTEALVAGGAQLPIATRLLIGTSSFLQNFWWLLIAVVGITVSLLRVYMRTPVGRRQLDTLKFHLPVFGQIFQKIYLVRFSRSFSTLIASGIPVTRALEIVADVIGNLLYKELTIATIKEVEAGNSIATVFVQSKIVPPMLPQMMIVGEQTGKLDLILDKLSAFYAKELENLVANLVSIIEPLILVIMGVAVAVIVMAILLPLYNLSGAIQ